MFSFEQDVAMKNYTVPPAFRLQGCILPVFVNLRVQRVHLVVLCILVLMTYACNIVDEVDESLIGAHECVVFQKYGCPTSVYRIRIHPDSSYMGVRSALPYIIRKRGATDLTELVELQYVRGDSVQMRVWTIQTEHGDIVIDNYIWSSNVVF